MSLFPHTIFHAPHVKIVEWSCKSSCPTDNKLLLVSGTKQTWSNVSSWPFSLHSFYDDSRDYIWFSLSFLCYCPHRIKNLFNDDSRGYICILLLFPLLLSTFFFFLSISCLLSNFLCPLRPHWKQVISFPLLLHWHIIYCSSPSCYVGRTRQFPSCITHTSWFVFLQCFYTSL